MGKMGIQPAGWPAARAKQKRPRVGQTGLTELACDGAGKTGGGYG